jgi:hypothetical protein
MCARHSGAACWWAGGCRAYTRQQSLAGLPSRAGPLLPPLPPAPGQESWLGASGDLFRKRSGQRAARRSRSPPSRQSGDIIEGGGAVNRPGDSNTPAFLFSSGRCMLFVLSWSPEAGAGTRRRRLVVRRAAALTGLTPLLTCPPAAAAWHSTRQPRARRERSSRRPSSSTLPAEPHLVHLLGGRFRPVLFVGEGWHSLSLATCIARACVHEFGICPVRSGAESPSESLCHEACRRVASLVKLSRLRPA